MSASIDTVLEIDTPEHLAFQTRIAGPGRRFFAYTIDLLVRGAIFLVCSFIFSFVSAATNLGEISMGLLFLLLFVLDWGYYVFCEVITGGRSPGKMALKLRVVRPNGLPITWRESMLRNLVRAADLTIFPPHGVLLLGPIVMAMDPKFRRLGDMVAGTIVVVEESTKVASKSAVDSNDRMVAELPATLPLDRTDLEALELFVNREHVSDARRQELAEIVAPLYARKLHLPTPRDPTAFLASLWARAQDPNRRIEG